jgi:flagellar motility protein MotE (MotC chaperone)
MKFVLILAALFLLAFLVTVVAALGVTGNLSGEALSKLLGGGQPAAADPAQGDDLDQLARMVRDREKALDEERASVEENRKRVEQTKREMEELMVKLGQTMQDVAATGERADVEYQERLKSVADTIASMDKKSAAQALDEYTPERAAEILSKLDEDARATILSEMDPGKVAPILEELRRTAFGPLATP